MLIGDVRKNGYKVRENFVIMKVFLFLTKYKVNNQKEQTTHLIKIGCLLFFLTLHLILHSNIIF
ncbi:hypothetical protein BH747_00080 [Enterococcus villorum]|uniref:Uncharacterized protein n=1 Tax=Enterococcus villorum TaxID=112904 RepID=A0A1V8YF47_9ENTE|nr:hypothetical protein BH747_00080 [Enterococcus villorum]OQO73548.1 hypothetical protein BH744_10070 [Enterococcus villorum]